MKHNFYDIKIDILTIDIALSNIKRILIQTEHKTLFFLNAHCFNIAQKNEKYFKALQTTDFLLNDGIGISIAGKLKGIKFQDNLNGTDFIPLIIKEGYINNQTFYLLGTKDCILEKTKENLKREYSGIKIVGMHNGFFSELENKNIINQINETKASIVIVGMGVPQQEIWISENKNNLPDVQLFIAGGAILDFLSGNIKRAPQWMRKMKIEWLYRLCLEPKRMWKRYLLGNILFFYYILKQKLGLYKNPFADK